MKNAIQTRLSVEGMSCGSCVMHVTRALEDIDGVDDVRVSLREGEVCVVFNPEKADVHKFIAALSEEGYPAKPLAELERAGRST